MTSWPCWGHVALWRRWHICSRENFPPIPQNEIGVTYASKLEKHEAEIDWRLSAENIDRAVRAFNPRPAHTPGCRGTSIENMAASTVAGTCPANPEKLLP